MNIIMKKTMVMSIKSYTILSLLVLSFVFVSCYDKSEEICTSENVEISAVNPNGDSELALLMRKMYDDADSIKKFITDSAGNITPEFISELEKIHTAIPTDSTVKTPEFEAYTKLMIDEANKLFSSTENKVQGFNQLVNRCIECHQSFCPGPIKKIKKLNI